MNKPNGGPRYPIESVDNALKLVLMVRERDAISVTQASDALGVGRSTAHRLLAMLAHHGFVRQDPATKSYVMGQTLIEVGLSALREGNIREQAKPFIENLVLEVGETAHLVVLREGSVHYIDCVEGQRAIRAGSRVGETVPAYATAAGKALLAELTDLQVEALYSAREFVPITKKTITSLPALQKDLKSVRRRGYAFNDAESEPELRAVAAAVRDRSGHARAAVTVAAPSFRLPSTQVAVVADGVLRAAKKISENLT